MDRVQRLFVGIEYKNVAQDEPPFRGDGGLVNVRSGLFVKRTGLTRKPV